MAPRARTIVVGYDGSEVARRALDTAADLVGYGSSITVVTVAGGPSDRADGERLLADARALLHRRQIMARYVEHVGDPASHLIRAAGRLEADLLVVGLRRGALKRLLPGSVGARVVRGAPCDVLLVR